MRIALGAQVLARDGTDLGVIKHLILDTDTAHVRAFAVEQGVILPHDLEISLGAVAEASNSDAGTRQVVRLVLNAEEARMLPSFDRALYTDPPGDVTERLGIPFGGVLWPAIAPSFSLTPGIYPVAVPVRPAESERASDNPEVDALLVEVERANAVIEVGSDVVSVDGETVGRVHALSFDAETGELRTLILARGSLFPQYREVPADRIASVDDSMVALTLTKGQLETGSDEAIKPGL